MKMDEGLQEILFNALNEHGFLFQERCAQEIQFSANIGWRLHVTEHPVSLKGKDTRIDIVIRDENSQEDLEVYGLIECKKVDPRYRCWLFGKSMYDAPVPAKAQIIKIEMKQRNHRRRRNVLARPVQYVPIRMLFNINAHVIDNWWVEVNLKSKNKRISDPQPIEDVFHQICTGIGGLAVEQERQRVRKLGDFDEYVSDLRDFEVYLVPIIITTAPLYVAAYDISDVDIKTGNINKGQVKFSPSKAEPESVNWVMVDYGAGSGVTPDELYRNFHGTEPVDLEPYNRRSIFVVNSSHIRDFLAQLHMSE
jgi:hypothetical protein